MEMNKATIKIYQKYFKDLVRVLRSRWCGINRRCNNPNFSGYVYYNAHNK
jgi:hypothetical protein